MSDEFIKRKAEWEEKKVKPTTDRFPERKETFKTHSGFDISRLYTPEDIKDSDYLEDVGFPAMYPFTRGVQPTMYRGRFWTMRQYAGFASAEESNQRYKMLIKKGGTGLSVAFDLPTQMGYDADHQMAHGEVGRVGVSICSLKDMETLFNEIDLSKVSTSMTINATAAVLLCMYIAVAENQGVEASALRGTIQNDLLKEYIARGAYIFPPQQSMRVITDLFAYCNQNVPKWNPISISGYHIREAGSTAPQEIGFTIANGIAYVDAAIKAGLDVDQFAGRLSFFFASHNNLLEEVAKFRAARRLWAKIMKERFHAKNPKSMLLRFHTQTAGCSLTAQQPQNNVVRVAMQALAAMLGGTQSLHTNSMDEALALPSEASATLALRTQQVLGYESGCADTIDPLAGSYYVESLTNQIEEKAMEYIKAIDDMGGSVHGIEQGYQSNEIHEAAFAEQRRIEKKEQIVVGVNEFKSEKETQVPIQRVTSEVEVNQCAKLKALREGRDNTAVDEAIKNIVAAAQNPEENLVPHILKAVKTYATLGEVADALRGVFGVHEMGGM